MKKTRAAKTRRPPAGLLAVTESDAERLMHLLQAQNARPNPPRTLTMLARKLDEAEWLSTQLIPADVVTMNSTVRLRNVTSGEEVVRTVTYPCGADPANGRVSILTSMGIAMLGRRVGETLVFDTREGETSFQIESLLYQPEAANDEAGV